MSIATKKRNKFVIDKLLAALGKLSDHELMDLATLLDSPSAAMSISNIIREQISLRRFENQKSSLLTEDIDEYEIAPSDFTPSEYYIKKYKEALNTTDQAAEMFASALGDRTLFPTTGDTIAGIQDFSGIRLNYNDYRKEGRKKVIRHFKARMQRMSKKQQQETLLRFFNWLSKLNVSQDDYGQLFRILARNE